MTLGAGKFATVEANQVQAIFPPGAATEVGQAPPIHPSAAAPAGTQRHGSHSLLAHDATSHTWLMSVAPCSTSSRDATATSQARLKAARGLQPAASWVQEAASASSTSTPKEQQICRQEGVYETEEALHTACPRKASIRPAAQGERQAKLPDCRAQQLALSLSSSAVYSTLSLSSSWVRSCTAVEHAFVGGWLGRSAAAAWHAQVVMHRRAEH